MNAAQYEECQSQILLFGQLVRELPLVEFLEAIRHAETVGPVVDPTLWIKANRSLSEIQDLAEGLLHFQNVVRRIIAPAQERDYNGGKIPPAKDGEDASKRVYDSSL